MAYRVLGFETVTGGDEVFEALVVARIVEPTSKLDSLRVLHEVGVAVPSYRTVARRLPAVRDAICEALWEKSEPRTWPRLRPFGA
jgi:hypothetical protein